MANTSTTTKDAPESGVQIGHHVSWRVNEGVDYIDGGDPMNHRAVHGARACGEVHSLGVDGDTPVAYVDQHDALHHRTGTMPCLAVDQLRRERAVNGATAFVSGRGAPVREGAGMGPYNGLLASVREAAGGLPAEAPLGTGRAMELLDALLTGR